MWFWVKKIERRSKRRMAEAVPDQLDKAAWLRRPLQELVLSAAPAAALNRDFALLDHFSDCRHAPIAERAISTLSSPPLLDIK